MCRQKLALIVLVVAMASGCWWPRVVPLVAQAPLYDSGFPLTGPARMDAALCSLSSVGGDVARLVAPPENVADALPLSTVCRKGRRMGVASGHGVGVVGTLVEIPTDPALPALGTGSIYAFVYPAAQPRGVVVLFSGLAMPSAGWINARFAELAAARGYTSVALVRDESRRPMRFDPRREALRGIVAGRQVRRDCGLPADARLAFLGISMGGIEALVAARDAPGVVPEVGSVTAAVLDPVIAPDLVASNLDRYWRSLSVDAMQDFFRRILIARYGERTDVSFTEFLSRTRNDGTDPTYTDPRVDVPAQWLCRAPVSSTIYLSTTDPVLGDEQRRTLECTNPPFARRTAGAPGHIPLACNLSLFQQMIADLP